MGQFLTLKLGVMNLELRLAAETEEEGNFLI